MFRKLYRDHWLLGVFKDTMPLRKWFRFFGGAFAASLFATHKVKGQSQDPLVVSGNFWIDIQVDEGGAPESWEGSHPLSPFSLANVITGNLFTQIPIVAFSGRGLDVSLTLFHNSSSASSLLPFGYGWTHSYRWRIDIDPFTEAAILLVSYVYEGFGKIIGQNGGGGGPYQFCGLWGYRNDWDAGLLHVGARYYEPEAGRFVQKDAWLGIVFNPLTLNRYVYCGNNPLQWVDPYGYNWEWPEWLMGIGSMVAAIGRIISVLPSPWIPTIPTMAVGAVIFAIGLGYRIGEKIGERLFPPDERCCGGECGRDYFSLMRDVMEVSVGEIMWARLF